MSEPSTTPDLRSLLRDAEPRDFATKKAWQEVIRALRARRRDTGEVPRLRAWADVERSLASVPASVEDIGDIKRLLRAMDKEGGGQDIAGTIDVLVDRLLPRYAEGPVEVDVQGWPPGFGPTQQARLLRQPSPPPLEVDAGVAAALVREFDGFVLAGSTLLARARVAAGEVLPPVPRALRQRPPRRGRRGPWLPYTDEQGKRSLTPRSLALRQARRLASDRVIDGYCGLGGNAIGFALEGADVIAVERDPSRLALARRNARSLGVRDRIDFRLGDVGALLPSLPPWPLFFDPPWEDLELADIPIPPEGVVMLKLPRHQDLSALCGSWEVFFEFGEGEDDESTVRMLTAMRR